MKPSQKELDEAIKAENDALLNYAKVLKRSETVEHEKAAARHQLSLARSNKQALVADLMIYA